MANGPGVPHFVRAKAHQFRIGFLVHDVSRMRRTLFDQAMKPLGVTRAQWWVLANLSRNEDVGMNQTDLARIMDLGKVTLGGLIDRLEATQLVERRPDATDRRVKRIFITPRGYEVLEEMQIVGKGLNAKIFDGLQDEDVRVAEDVLHKMKENLRRSLNGSPISDDEDSGPGDRQGLINK